MFWNFLHRVTCSIGWLQTLDPSDSMIQALWKQLCVLSCLALRTKGFEFLASLGNIVRYHFKNKNQNQNQTTKPNQTKKGVTFMEFGILPFT